MNKSDKVLVLVVLIPVLIICSILLLNNKTGAVAKVYYENNVILTIDLTKSETKYNVKGYNGNVSILAGNGRIKVVEEISPNHICSRQGYISKSYESIICLPNKIVIKIEDSEELDATL